MNSLSRSLALFKEARSCYVEKQFGNARRLIEAYRKSVQYELIEHQDRRKGCADIVSIIIVSFNAGEGLLGCLDSLARQSDQDFEIILVDNGGNEGIRSQLVAYPLLYLAPPVNLLPSEGRNLGASFARGRYLVFIDDDALVHPDYVQSVKKAWSCFGFLALRGKILPKGSSSNNSFTGHYDLGEFPIPAVLMTEGNMAIKKDVFITVGGFDPLIFGGEGTELSWRCWKQYHNQDIFYWPKMVIFHDFAQGDNLVAKKQRHALAADYFNYLSSEINSLTSDYGKWYHARPRGKGFYDRRSIICKAKAFLWEKQIVLKNRYGFRPADRLPISTANETKNQVESQADNND